MELHWQRTMAAFHFLIGWPREAEPPDDYAPVLPYMAIPGLVLSLLSLLIVSVCSIALSQLAAMLFGTVLLTVLWAAVSRGQNLLAAGRLSAILQATLSETDDEEQLQVVQQISILVVLLLKLACLAILVYRGSWGWIMLVPLGAAFYALEMSIRSGYFASDAAHFRSAHLMAVAAFFTISLAAGLRGLFVMAIVWLVCVVVAEWTRTRLPGRHAELINGGSEFIELLILLIGVVFLT